MKTTYEKFLITARGELRLAVVPASGRWRSPSRGRGQTLSTHSSAATPIGWPGRSPPRPPPVPHCRRPPCHPAGPCRLPARRASTSCAAAARRTKGHTVASDPCSRMARLMPARSSTCSMPSATANASSSVCSGNLDQDAQHASAMVEADETLGVSDRRQTRLDANAALAQAFHDDGRRRLAEIDRGIVRQFAPAGDGDQRADIVVLDPGAGGDADQRAGAGAAQRCDRRIHRCRRKAFAPVGSARMDMQLGRASGNRSRPVARHGFGVEREGRVEIGGTRAVDAGLDDHGSRDPVAGRTSVAKGRERGNGRGEGS